MEKLPKNLFGTEFPADTVVAEKEQMLEANCLRPEEKDIKKYFELEEMTEMRRQFYENAVEIRKANEAFVKARDAYKVIAEPLEKQNKSLMQQIRTGFVEVRQQVYLFDSQAEGMMGYYDNSGELIESRRLIPEERQTRVPN